MTLNFENIWHIENIVKKISPEPVLSILGLNILGIKIILFLKIIWAPFFPVLQFQI